MTSTSSCVVCKDTELITRCEDCQKYFCSSDRAEQTQQMDKIYQDQNVLEQDINQQYVKHPFLSQINTWEKESIQKIQSTARIARYDLQQILDRHKNDVRSLTNEVQLNNYTEIHLNKWTEQLKELQKSLNINFIDNDDEDPSIIHLIKVNHQQQKESAMNTSNSLSRPTQEKFGKVIGASILSEDGIIAIHSGFIFSCSNISGINLYSSGINHIRFRLEKNSATCPFFGIYSSSQEMTRDILSFPSVYGWWEFDQTIINGHKHGCRTNKTFQSGDEITLTLDCENKHILLRHHRTNKFVQHTIDIQLCPLPWKILLRLYGAVSRVRILQ